MYEFTIYLPCIYHILQTCFGTNIYCNWPQFFCNYHYSTCIIGTLYSTTFLLMAYMAYMTLMANILSCFNYRFKIYWIVGKNSSRGERIYVRNFSKKMKYKLKSFPNAQIEGCPQNWASLNNHVYRIYAHYCTGLCIYRYILYRYRYQLVNQLN